MTNQAAVVTDMNLRAANNVRLPKFLLLLAALIGAVQGSLLLNALPAMLDSTARIVLQDSAYLLFIAGVWRLDGVNVKRWLLSPVSATCVLFLILDVIVQVLHGLASGDFSMFTVFRETRLFAYFFLAMLSFGSVKHWGIRDAPTVVLQVLFVFAGIGAFIYMILAFQIVGSGGDLNFFDSYQDAKDAGFGNAFHDKFKSPPIMISFLSAYLLALLISPTSSRSFIGKACSRALQLIAMASIIWIALFSYTRSLLAACFVGVAVPVIIEVIRAISFRRFSRFLLARSIGLYPIVGLLIFGAILTVQNRDEKFVEQIVQKNFLNDQSDASRYEAMKRTLTFDFDNPLGFGVGAGSNYVQLEAFWMNPIDSGLFHAVVVLGYQFLIPYLVLFFIAVAFAFSNGVRRSENRFDFSLRSGLLAGLLFSLPSFYQASPFLFPADAMLSGAALGASISIHRYRRNIKKYGAINDPVGDRK